jgi:hypothetical protein
MTEQTSRPSEPAGGDGLLMIIATAVVVVVIGEAAFVAHPRMWLLPLAILGALIVTAGVIYATLLTIENDTPEPPSRPEPEPEPESQGQPVRARPLIGH